MRPEWRLGTLRTGADDPATSLVVKIGGSLLARAGWPGDIGRLLALGVPTGTAATIVVGGGAIVDGLRVIDAASPQADPLVHRLAIEAMSLTATLVATALRLPLVDVPARCEAPVVLDVAAWLRGEGRHAAVPAGWHVTSDSLAAVVAAATAGRLMLAKSTPPPRAGAALAALAEEGWVDAYFPTAARNLAAIAWAAPIDDHRPATAPPAADRS